MKLQNEDDFSKIAFDSLKQNFSFFLVFRYMLYTSSEGLNKNSNRGILIPLLKSIWEYGLQEISWGTVKLYVLTLLLPVTTTSAERSFLH